MLVSLMLGLLTGCSEPAASAPPSPPIATGARCVDVEPAGATVMVGGTVLTERCTQLTEPYSNRTTLKVTAPGHQPYEKEVAPVGTETLKVTLTPVAE